MPTASEHQDDLLAAFKSGARGYVLKGTSAKELTRVLRAVAAGEVYVSPSRAAGILLDQTRRRSPEPLDRLTEREREAQQLLSKGWSNREIGEQLQRAEKTIKHYMTNILQKLQVRSRVEAALLATQEK